MGSIDSDKNYRKLPALDGLKVETNISHYSCCFRGAFLFCICERV